MMDPGAVIPHRPPFLFVDKIIEIGDSYAVGQKTFKEDEFFYKGHYPDYPITPGVILCESVFQVAAFFAINKLGSVSMEEGIPVLARVGEARFRRSVFPGSTVTLRAEFLESMGKFMMMQGAVLQGDKLSVSVKFSMAFTDSK
ncbi:MAG: beta-hydroxyacyl-ACP dehydratase [Puniceicoccales bacterium]|jgi:3-hydroxyacyl-[acyl-carrier-protein] dehydratase|nr:beta-hydroxyacyl-ACP dehydratase [Puniceicoccales bacterium]